VEKIVQRTNSAIDLAARRRSVDFLGEVLRLIDDARQQPAHLAELLGELYQDRRGRRFLEKPGEGDLLELLNEIENLCLDELVME
jgi:hypothetical protein